MSGSAEHIRTVVELFGSREPVPHAPEQPRIATRPLEPSDPADRYVDYVLAPYVPPTNAEGKLRAVNLLYESFAFMGVEAQGVALVDALRDGLGQGATVFGIKHVGGKLTWELYFYNPARDRPGVNPEGIAELLSSIFEIAPKWPRRFAWHMFSIDFDAQSLLRRKVEQVHVYVNGSEQPGASRSYCLSSGGLVLENLYTFHDPRLGIDDLLDRLRASVHIDTERGHLAHVLWPELFRCRRICVANKPRADGMYFSGLTVDQALFMLRVQTWPTPILELLTSRKDRLDHVLWDAGFDFQLEAGATSPTISKSALYANF
jgi:hypothetical protein